MGYLTFSLRNKIKKTLLAKISFENVFAKGFLEYLDFSFGKLTCSFILSI